MPSTVTTSGQSERLRSAKYAPMKAITSGTVSLQAAASTRKTAALTQRSSSMYRKAQRSSGVARATGWNSFRTRNPSAG